MTITLVRIQIYNQNHPSVADPDLQIEAGGAGGGGGHPDSDISGGGLKKMPHFGQGIGGAAPPGPLPWIRHCPFIGLKGLKTVS